MFSNEAPDMALAGHRPLTRVRLFGAGVIERGGHPLATRTRKELHLLALLLLRQDRPAERDWLAEELWPDSEQPLYNLSRSLGNLKAVLGGDEVFRLEKPSPRALHLRPDALEVDLLTFDALIRQDTSEALAAAVDLYCGPLLPNCLDAWIRPEREAREQVCLKALRRLADEARDAGDLVRAGDLLRRALAIDPLNEESVRALMQILADQGTLAAANQVYRKLRQRLSEHLLPGPDRQTQALFENLRASHSKPAAPPLPALRPEHRLIGREREMWEVSGLLAQSRLVTLTGIGGIGKTRLAIAVADECAADYAEGTCFIDLSALSDPRRVVQAVAGARGVREQAGQELLQTLLADLRERSLLLVLDNCEHLRAACMTLCEALLVGCRNLRILATSRQALGLPPEMESIWRAPALELPPRLSTPAGTPAGSDARMNASRTLAYGAIRLFVERAKQVEPGFAPTASEVETIVQICRQLDGNALAIELAAARVGALPVQEIAARLDDRFQLLQGGKRSLPRRQQALQASMDWSYDLLTEEEARLFQRLSVFAGGWTPQAAEAVCDSNVHLLTSLVDKSLVVYEGDEGREARYRFLETVREYALKRLTARREAFAIQRRHRDYFLMLAEEEAVEAPRSKARLDRIEREHDNLRAALDFCLKGREEGGKRKGEAAPTPPLASLLPPSDEAGLRLGFALYRFWEDRGHLIEGRERLAALLAQAEARPPTLAYAKVLCRAGTLALWQGDYTVARAQSEQSLMLARRLNNRLVIAGALSNLGILAHWQGDYVAAQAAYEESLSHAQELDPGMMVSMLSDLGEIAREQGHYDRARALQEESLKRAREMGDPSAALLPLTHLGNIAHHQGDYNTARALYQEGLAVAQDLGDPWRIALLLGNLGSVAQAQGDYRAALAPFEECLALLQRLGDKRNGATALIELASLHFKTGDEPQARLRLAESLHILRETEDRFFMGAALITCASIARARGSLEWAATLFGAAEALHNEMGASLPPTDVEERRREIEAVRAALDREAFERWWNLGQTRTLDAAGALGLSFLNGSTHPEANEPRL
jgi:predicted ATPase/DNA-binding SARP family transcriptional activator